MDAFILEREKINMINYPAIEYKDALKDNHIKFFVDSNPGWIKGNQLIIIGLVKWPDIFRSILKTLLRKHEYHNTKKAL